MNDYIVWYSDENNQNMFSEEFTLEQLINQDHLDIVSDSPFLRNFKIDNICNGIGIKDINKKQIYADCSIVEIEYLTKEWNKATGYFKYINSELGYCFQVGEKLYIRIHKLIFKNIKIIDSIQENKLGLIK